ncbi:MAG TPA: TetR/AcrR family transcriptional regulator [Galbitalea sp.]|jgi:AcrR family transcriptional regulator|nr:TetR/AcrR family transcriptional regulator [Galbitalea sp.]
MTQLDLEEHPTSAAPANAAPANAAPANAAPANAVPANRVGRPLDVTRDADILDAALDVLAEVGYDGMTIDMVAARAKAGKATLYRRWPSKTELVIDAVACMKNSDIDPDNLPDTGTLRGDMIAMIKPPTIRDGEKKLRVMAGLISLLARNPELADVAHNAVIAPRARLNRILLQRAIDRGEIRDDLDLALIANISPSMVTYRTMMLRKPVDRDFLVSIIDKVILPAVGLGSEDAGRR